MATINVKDDSGASVAIEKPLAPGRAAATASKPVALSTEDLAQIAAIVTQLSTLVKPGHTSAGVLSATLSGTTAVAFASQTCLQATINNESGVTVEVQLGGAGAYFRLSSGRAMPIPGITNTSQIGVRRFGATGASETVSVIWSA
jgi:hypothetical protein